MCKRVAAASLECHSHRGDDVNRDDLLRVLRRTRERLARPDNNFLWSSWKDADAALREIDAAIAAIDAGGEIDLVNPRVLFAPAGPIQDVSASSGWGDAFLELSAQFDAAMEN